MDSLSAEVLVHIFDYLPTVEVLEQIPQVCSRWREVAASLYKAQNLNFDNTSLSTRVFSTEEALHLLGAAPELKSLQMYYRPDTAEILQFVAQYNRRLRSLEIECPEDKQVPSLAFRAVLSNCSEIDQLSLICVYYPFSDTEFNVDLKKCLPQLRKLTLWEFNMEDVRAALRSCPPLEELDLNHQHPDDIMELVAEHHGETLKVLKVYPDSWGDVGYAAIARCCRLQHMSLTEPVNMSDRQMMGLVVLKDLRSLSIDHAVNVTAEGWKEMFRARPFQNMASLNISACSSFGDDELIAALIAFPGLTSLEVDMEGEITEYSLSTLPRLTPRLRLLKVSNIFVFEVTDEQKEILLSLRDFLQDQMPQLEFIMC